MAKPPMHVESNHPDCPAAKPHAVVGVDKKVASCHMTAAEAKQKMKDMEAGPAMQKKSKREYWRI